MMEQRKKQGTLSAKPKQIQETHESMQMSKKEWDDILGKMTTEEWKLFFETGTGKGKEVVDKLWKKYMPIGELSDSRYKLFLLTKALSLTIELMTMIYNGYYTFASKEAKEELRNFNTLLNSLGDELVKTLGVIFNNDDLFSATETNILVTTYIEKFNACAEFTSTWKELPSVVDKNYRIVRTKWKRLCRWLSSQRMRQSKKSKK